jgi:hypothetical protein
MYSVYSLMQQHMLVLKPREGRVLPARAVRLKPAQCGVALYDEDHWGGLPPRLANCYSRFEDKARQAIRERLSM